MDLGKRLQSLRKTLKLSQTELGECLGISKSAIASYENGYNPLPDYVINSISDKFNISSEFFSDESIDVNNLSKSLIERNIVNVEFFNDISDFIDKKNAKKIALPYDFFTFLFPFAPNKKYYMARWRGDSILVFDDEQKMLNGDDCQVLVANHDLVFTGVYDYKKGVVKIKDQAFFDNIKIDKWDFFFFYKYKIKSDILKLSDLKR